MQGELLETRDVVKKHEQEIGGLKQQLTTLKQQQQKELGDKSQEIAKLKQVIADLEAKNK